MTVLGADSAEIHIYTFKEGLLSAVAHDLKLRATRFEISIDGDVARGAAEVRSIVATVDPGSLSVICARKDGRDAPRTLSGRDKRKIVKYITNDVLHPQRYPVVRFESQEVGNETIVGQLSLHGEKRPVRWTLHADSSGFRAQTRIHQPNFGIKPFTAMLGALAIKPDVTVEVRVRI